MAITALSRSRAVHQGVALSGTFAARPKNAHDGAMYYATDLDRLLFCDSSLKAWFPVDGGTLYVSGQKYLTDLFRLPALDAGYDADIGTDATDGDAPVIATTDGEGSVVFVSGNDGTGVEADGSALARALIWEMEEAARATVVAARLKISAITNVELFIGLTDVLPSTTLEMPFDFTDGTTIQNTATDACGFLFDTTATTDSIRLVGSKNGTAGTSVDSGSAPVAATYHDYVMVVDVNGDAYFFFDGTYEGVVEDAISVGVDVSPIVIINATTTSSRTANLRRLACHQDF